MTLCLGTPLLGIDPKDSSQWLVSDCFPFALDLQGVQKRTHTHTHILHTHTHTRGYYIYYITDYLAACHMVYNLVPGKDTVPASHPASAQTTHGPPSRERRCTCTCIAAVS